MKNYERRLEHIVYDIDDVLADFWKTTLPLFNQEFGSDENILKFEDLTSFNGFVDRFNITKDDFLDFIKNTVPMSDLEPTPYVDLMNHQYAQCHKISIVTSRDYIPDADAMTRSWLSKVGANYHDLHISGQKLKSEFFSMSSVDVVYEDHQDNIDDYFDSGVLLGGIAGLVDKPWNRSYIRENVVRIYNTK
jgi:uncharacterized HAD superfamily protein